MKKPKVSNTLARPKLSREMIIATALDLADKDGLTAVSMRPLAQSLKVEAMSLYKHVENKDDLIDGMIEMIAAEMKMPSEKSKWKNALKDYAFSVRGVLNRHAWAVSLFESRSGTGADRLRQQNHMIGILRRAGFSIELAFNTMIALTGYIYGFVIFEQSWSTTSPDRVRTQTRARASISPTDHPYVFEMITFAQSRSKTKDSRHEDDFNFGLSLLMDGLEKQLRKK